MDGPTDSLAALATEIDQVRDNVQLARERADRVEGKLLRLAALVSKAAATGAYIALVEFVAVNNGTLTLPLPA